MIGRLPWKIEALIDRPFLEVAYTKSFPRRITEVDSEECDCGYAMQDVPYNPWQLPRFTSQWMNLRIGAPRPDAPLVF